MKHWKKGWSIILTLALVFSTLGMAFSASAAEEPFQYPEGVTKEKTANAIEGLDNAILNLINPEKGIYTNYTAGLIAQVEINLLQSLANGAMAVYPQSFWFATSDMPNNPLEPYMSRTTWDNTAWDDIDVTKMDWGVTDGDQDSFFAALRYVLRPLCGLLIMVSDENQVGPGDGNGGPDMSMGLPVPVYRFALYPIYNALGLASVTPDEYTATYSYMTIAYGDDEGAAFMEITEKKDAVVAEMQAAQKAGQTETYATKKAELATFDKTFMTYSDIPSAPILDPILTLVKQLLAAPLPTLLDLLPKLDTMISGGTIDWVFGLIAPDATEQPASLVDVLNLVLGTLPLIEDGTTAPDGTPNKKPLGITLPAFDFASLADLEQEEAFITVLRYLIDAIKQEQNIAALTKLVQGTDLESIMGLLPSLETDAAVSLVISMFNPEPEEPSTDDDPTQQPDATQPGGHTTEPTEPATQPAGTDTPDTGDHAVPVFSAVTLAAAAAFVLLRKKQR